MSGAPPKPWERSQSTAQSGKSATPLGPSTGGPKPWEANPPVTSSVTSAVTSASRSPDQNDQDAPLASTSSSTTIPQRPWERPNATTGALTNYSSRPMGMNAYTSPYSSYGMNRYGYGSGYGSYGSYGSSYGTGYGGYGGGYGSMGNYGYRSPYGSPYGAGGMYGGSYGEGAGPNGPLMSSNGQSPAAWQSFLHGLHRIVECFGRVSFLVDENAQAIHFFISALLQMLDRVGSLYGEIARFALRLLGYKGPKKKEVGNKEGQKQISNQQSDWGVREFSKERRSQQGFSDAWGVDKK